MTSDLRSTFARNSRAPNSRRRFLGSLASTLAAAGFSPLAAGAARAFSPQCQPGTIAPAPTTLPALNAVPLGTAAQGANLAFGAQIAAPPDTTYGPGLYDATYRSLILREKPQFVALGNAFKFGNLCPDDPVGGPLTFTNTKYKVANTWWEANDTVAFFKPQGVRARADALVAQATAPSWLKPLPPLPNSWWQTPEFASNRAYLQQFMSAAMKKIIQLSAGDPNYFGSLLLVNEAIDPFHLVNGGATYAGGPFQPAGIPCTQATPATYIWDTFYAADRYNTYWSQKLGLPKTNARLLLNETGADTDQFGPLVRQGILAIVKAMRANNVRIDGIGLECHLQPQMMFDAYHPDWTAFGNFLAQLQSLGLEVHITELDVLDYETSCHGGPGGRGDSDFLTRLYYDSFLRKALSYSCVKSVCVWDLADRYSFYRNLDESKWLAYDQIPSPKPAGTWPNCPVMPAAPNAIACARPDVYDDTYLAKPARQAMANAFLAAPRR